jgi:hypothetical protein
MSLDHFQVSTVLSNFSSYYAPIELKGSIVIGTKMLIIECMRYHSFLIDHILSSKHIIVLEKVLIALATTLVMFQKHQNNSFLDM